MCNINEDKLKGKLVENAVTRADAAEKLGISTNTLSRKINGKSDFTLSEVLCLCSLLYIENPCEVFLPSLSQICNNKSA